MRKLKFLSFVALAGIATLSSCEEVVTSPTTVDLLPKAIVTGYVTAETNLNNSSVEAAPITTQILVEVNYSDIKAGATGKWQDTLTVDADGKYTAIVPTDANGVTVTIIPLPFEYDQIQSYGSYYSKLKKSYTLASSTEAAVKSGETRFKNLAYAPTTLPDIANEVSVMGTVKAEMNDTKAGLEKVTYQSITVTIGDFVDTYDIDSEGNFSFEIPKNTAASYKIDFTANKTVGGSTNSHNYLKTGTISASTGPVVLNIVAE